MKIARRKARVVKAGKVSIGGNYPIAIQSMTNTRTADIDKTVKQIRELENSGCEIVRVAVQNSEDAKAIKKIKPEIRIPIVADIHFNWRLALEAIDNGADKIRLNPGNIYKKEQIKEVVNALKQVRLPLRIGINSGSVRGLNSKKSGMPDKLARAALDYIRTIEKLKFHDIVISLKASNVLDTIEAYRKIAKACDYPLHLGLTATGLPQQGAVKSSIALGVLLSEGIGDTLRVSLTDNPVEEVKIAKYILEALDLRRFGPQIISCPTCGRCEVDLIRIVKNLERSLSGLTKQRINETTNTKIAVMGCVVNGPGEAKEADIGIAFGKKEGLLFRKGKAVRKVSPGKCVELLIQEIKHLN